MSTQINILQINGYESPGKRFHGLGISKKLQNYGINSSHFVWHKDTDDQLVLTCNSKIKRVINSGISAIENYFSLQSVLYSNFSSIKNTQQFMDADLIHLHIIHSGFFKLSDLIELSRIKPTVWTLHDPWALTGHCVYPIDCERWRIGCGNCPDLKTPFALKKDNTRMLFEYKNRVYKNSNIDLIVASEWMKNKVMNSPLFDDKQNKITKIPFGVDLEFFSKSHRKTARRKFNIADDAIVITFRGGLNNTFKGVPYILEALNSLSPNSNIFILSINCYEELNGKLKFPHLDLGWVNDEELMRDFTVASDIFLMPSIAEAFGVMAIEAMASSVPVIVFEGTSLPEVVFSPEVGIAVPARDWKALGVAIQQLIDDPIERKRRGSDGRKLAELHYDETNFINNLADYYMQKVKK